MDYLKSLTEDEYQILINSSLYMEYYFCAHQAISILNENIIRLKGLVDRLESDDRDRTTLHTPLKYDQIESSLNTQFFNMLSSFYHFINYIEVCFKEWFGKTSTEANFIQSKKSEYFDKYFEYRFFYKLRNYVTHCGIPINILFDGTDERGFLFTQTWYFSKYLLARYDEWGLVKKDLMNRETIMIFPAIFAFDRMMIKLWKDIDTFLLQRFKQPAKTLHHLLNEVDNLDDNKKLCVLSYDGEGNDLIYLRIERGEEIRYTEKSLKIYILNLILNSQNS